MYNSILPRLTFRNVSLGLSFPFASAIGHDAQMGHKRNRHIFQDVKSFQVLVFSMKEFTQEIISVSLYADQFEATITK